MYLILSRENAFELRIAEYFSKLEDAQAFVRQRIAEMGDHADRLHPEAYRIVQEIEVAPGEH